MMNITFSFIVQTNYENNTLFFNGTIRYYLQIQSFEHFTKLNFSLNSQQELFQSFS
jgi:hypothetical protein